MTDVIVIGTGVAGPTAARQRVRAGMSVQVLEARKWPGGRVWIDRRLGIPVELRASRLHEVARHRLTALAVRQSLATVATDHGDQILFDRGHRLALALCR
ncbi:MAG: FAD-dependent oxidoreductase [Candidatus Competibacteraceae bacterium]|nr:FAD-dependent oxidoreductase [Candidatus Competibacteraceae bacterium]